MGPFCRLETFCSRPPVKANSYHLAYGLQASLQQKKKLDSNCSIFLGTNIKALRAFHLEPDWYGF